MFGSGMKWLPLASYKDDEEEERRRKALTTQTAGRPSLTSHVPILKQLEDMLIQKISPQRAEPQTHVVRPGDTLWGMAEQHLPGGGPQWPDIRDLNIQTLQEGLERFPKDDPRRKKELGHWIFPEQEFQLPMPGREPEPEPEPEPTGLMEEIRRLIENPPKRFSEGDPVMAKGRETLPEAPASPTVRLEGDEGIKHPLSIESIEQDPFFKMGGAVVEDIKRRADEAKAPPKTAGKDTDMLVEQYLEWNFGRKGKSPTEEDVATAIRKVTEYPEMYRKGFANEAPKTAAGKVGSFISRMFEAGANAFTLTEGDMPMDTTGNAAADGIAETAGNLMGLLSPEGPVQAIFGYMGQVFLGIAPKLATILKVPVNLVQRSLTASGGMAVLGGYTTESFKETPKEMGKGAVVGAFMGVAEHIAGPVMNAVSKRFGVPVGSKAEMALEVIHTQGTSMSALSAGYGILEGKSAKEVAKDAVTGYALGALLGGISVGYNEARFRMQGKGFTMKGQKGQDINKVIKKMMEDGWVQIRPGVFEHPNQPPGYHRTLEVEYKGETISLSRLMRQHGGEIPKGTIFPEGAGAPGVPAETPRRISGLIGEGGEVTPRTTEVTPTAPATTAVTEGKMPQAARDLVVRTKNPLKKEYGRGIITWLEGGEKPSIPEGLSEAEAQDIETKLVKMAEREGITPAETTPVTPEPTETEAAPPPEGEPAGAEKQIQDWLDSVTADYPAESKKSVQEGIMRFIAENNDTVRKQGLEAVPRLAAEAGYIEKAPVVEVAPKEPEKPPESAKEPWLMTRDEFLQEKLNKYPNAPKMQMEAWESQYDTALADSPRDADIPLHVFDTLNPELQRHLMKYNSKLEKAVLEREAKKGLEGDKKKPAPGAKVPDQVRLGRFITHKGTEGIAYKDDRGGYRMKFEGSDIEYNYSLNFVKEWIEEPGDKKGLGEDKEKKPASKPKSLTISDYGLHIEKTKTARGNPVWEVSGNTHQHKDALKKAGGKWYGAKRVWSFYGDNDPTGTLLDVLAGKEVKISDVDTGEAGITETTGSGKITGLDSRIPIQQAEKAHYGQFLITRGGIPSDAQKGPGNDPAISKILRPHQVDGVNMAVAAIDQYGGFILADGTGAGKTMQIVATMNHYAKHGEKVLVVVPNRTIINDAYRRDAEMLGIEYNEVKNGVLESGKINITTYASLNKVREAPDYVAFDESHSLKNVDAARSKLGRRMAINAKGALFASATPFDKGEHLPYLEKTGIFSMKSHDQVMVSLGYKKDTIKVKTSYGERQVTVWKPDASLESRVKRMDMLFDEIADLGIMVKREVSMDKVAVGYWNISLPAEAHVKMNEIEDFYLNKYEVGDVSQLFPLAKAQMLMAQRRFQEHYKVADVYALAKSEIDAGRQVIIFATRTSPSHLKEQVYATMGGKRVLVDEFIVDTSPPTLPDIAEMFEKEGFKCSKIYGSGNVDSEVAKFQKGETRIALATPEKGGAGLSLDDTVGDSPRTMIVMTPLFSGTDNVQLPGRINRMSTKSPSKVVYVLADTAIDEWNKAIITEKMKTLNAVVKGDIERLDLSDMDKDMGMDMKEERKPGQEPSKTPSAEKEKPQTPAIKDYPIDISPEDVSYDLARNAYRGISMVPDERATQIQHDYINHMSKLYDELKPLAKTPEQQEVLKGELERYKQGYLKHLNAILNAKSKTLSPMIAGPARFPVERNRKAMETEMRRVDEMSEWKTRAKRAIKRKLEDALIPGRGADKVYNKLKKAANDCISTLVEVDAGKAHYDKSAFRNSLAGYIRRAVDNREYDAARKALQYIREAQDKLLKSGQLKQPVFTDRNSIWKYPDEVEAKRGPAKTGMEVVAEYDGVTIENHYDDDRTRIVFDDKPSEEVRKMLKGHGFRWSPNNEAWQRKLTDNAIGWAKRILDKHYTKVEAKEETAPKKEAKKPAPEEKAPEAQTEDTKKPIPEAKAPSTEPIAGYTEITMMDTKTTEEITLRREYRIHEPSQDTIADLIKAGTEEGKAKKPYHVQQRVLKDSKVEEDWKLMSSFGELKDAREYVAGVDNIVAVDSDVAELTKKGAPKEKVEPLKPFKPIAKGNKDFAFTETENIKIEFEYCLTEADDVVTSFKDIHAPKPNPAYYQDEPGLQPRNIERKATEHRINDFVAKLEPLRMGENIEISKGAPTVGADGRVEIGNHRTWALITAYKKDLPLAGEYREWLTNNAEKFGISKSDVEGAKEPILVRLRLTEIDRAALAKKGNVPGEQKMSAAEVAELDALEIDDGLMATFVPHDEGRVETRANKPFISKFIGEVVPSSERNDMMAGDGSGLTVNGVKRIKNAILAKVYGNTNALIKLMEESTPNVRNIMNAMNAIAPRLMLQKHEMEKGNLFPLDLSENLSRAMLKLSELRDSKMTVKEYFDARQLFGVELTNLEKDILAILDENKFSAKRIGMIFKEYMDGVEKLGNPKQLSILSKTPPTRAELLDTSVELAKEKWELTKSEKQEKAGQSTLFQDQEVDGEGTTEKDKGAEKGSDDDPESISYQLKREAETTVVKPAPDNYTPPKNTVMAYKLCQTNPDHPGKVFPLYVEAENEFPIGKWSIGEFVHIKKGKQKDMDLTYRPGLHALWKPDSKHIQMEGKVRTKVGNRVRLVKAPRVWARVELSADVNWQKLAETTRTKDIRAMIPRGGYYLWKRPPREGGMWYIAGEMKVHKVLSDAEVNDIMSKITDKDFPSIEAARAQSIAPNPERVGIVNLANASWDNPHLSPKEVQYVYTEEKRIEYLDRKELDKRGYHHLPEGRYQVTGLTEVLPGEPRKVLLYPGASKDTLLEENTHVLYDKLNEIDPELKKDILGWEEAVAAKAAKLGIPIPSKGELFAKAFTFAEMGYAKEEPELANLLSIPESITNRFLKILGANKKGINSAELWRGQDMPGVPREERGLHVDMDEIGKGEITTSNIESRAYQIKRIKPKIPENEKAVSSLMEIADHLSMLPDQRHKVPAYRNAAVNIAKQGKSVAELISKNDLRKIPGIGPSINAKLEELNKTGKIDYLNELKEKSFTEEVISLAHDYQRMAGGDVKDHLKSAQKALNPGKTKMSKKQEKVAKNNHKRAELEIKNIERRIEQGYRPIYESEMLANAGLPVTPESRRNMVGYLWHDDMFIPKPKEADQWSKQDMTALEKAPNILDKWVRPLYRTLIREMTNEGTISKKQIHVYVNKYISIIDKATKGFTRAEISRTSAMLEGLMKAEGKEGKAAKTIREQFFDPLFKEAVDAGILKPGQYVEDYYSHIVENVKKISGDSIDMGKAWFTHERTGDLKDYNRDVREVAYIYVNAMAKRLFVEPVIQKWKPAMMEMHPDRRKMAEDFFQEILGRPLGEERLLNQLIADIYALTGKDLTGRPAQEVSRFMVSLFAQDKMGLSMVAAIRNHTQKLLAIVDVDPIRGFGYAAKAQKWLLTRGGQDFVNKYCTLLNQRIYYEGLQEIAYYHSNLNKLMDKTSKLTMSFFRWADLNNVKISFLIGYFGGLRKGMSVAEAIDFGNDVALRTQYPYDVRRAPLYRGPIGKTIGLFTSWSGHFLELQADWINQRSFHKILLAALYLAGAEYLARKFGLVIRAGVTDIIKGHILYKAAKGEPGVLRSYINDFKKVANRLRSGDPEEWKRAVIEFTYLMPAGVFWKRLHRFVEAAGDNWIVRRDDGTILYEFSKDDWLSQKTGIPKEAVLSLLGQTTENAERWEYSGKLDKALQAIADPSVTDVVFMRDPDAAVAKLKEDAQRLNLNYAEELGKSKGRLRVKYYDKLYEAHSKGNKDKVKEIESILWELGAKPSGVWEALRNRYEKRK